MFLRYLFRNTCSTSVRASDYYVGFTKHSIVGDSPPPPQKKRKPCTRFPIPLRIFFFSSLPQYCSHTTTFECVEKCMSAIRNIPSVVLSAAFLATATIRHFDCLLPLFIAHYRYLLPVPRPFVVGLYRTNMQLRTPFIFIVFISVSSSVCDQSLLPPKMRYRRTSTDFHPFK